MTIISAIKSYLENYSGLASGAPVWVDYLGPTPTEYVIVPIPGSRIIQEYISGKTIREFTFAFQSVESTADELERLESLGFFEAFADWLEHQSEVGDLPSLGANQEAENLEATGWGYLFQQGESQTGIYQIQCRLTYEQDPLEEVGS